MNYPIPYQNTWGYNGGSQPVPQMPAQVTNQPPVSYAQPNTGMKWVDGESEARGTAMPAGTTQYAMWDINEPVIYIKSMNQMGMPNPMRKAHYWFEGEEEKTSGEPEPKPDMSEYVKKDDLERMKQDLMDTIDGLRISWRRGTAGE